jgi:hypothetical protein
MALIRDALTIIDCAAGKLFAQECQIDYPVEFYRNLIRVLVPDLRSAKQLLNHKHGRLSQKCAEWGQDKVELVWSFLHRPLCIHASDSGDANMSNIITATKNGRPNLADANKRQVLEFILEQREAGKVVVVTSQITNRCVDIDLISPERGIFAYASQWHGMNFMELWRESMDQYFSLLGGLERDGYIPNFAYDLLRVDGSLGRYNKDYYLARNFLHNEPVRISVGNQNDWELVRPAAV